MEDKIVKKAAKSNDDCSPSEDNRPQIQTFYNQKKKSWMKAVTGGKARKDVYVKCGSKRTFKAVADDDPSLPSSIPSGNVNEAELCNEDDDNDLLISQTTASKRFKNESKENQLSVINLERVDLAADAASDDCLNTHGPITQEVGEDKQSNLDIDRLLSCLEQLPDNLPVLSSDDVDKELNQSPTTQMQSFAKNIHDLGNSTFLNITKNVKTDTQPSLPDFEKLIDDSPVQKGQDSKLMEKKKISEFTPSRTPQLWYFILKCLCSCENTEVVKWISRCQGIFKITNEGEFAKLWSEEKCRMDVMPFTSIKRSIRDYRNSDIMKTIGKPKDNTWQFGDGTDWEKLAFSVKAMDSYT